MYRKSSLVILILLEIASVAAVVSVFSMITIPKNSALGEQRIAVIPACFKNDIPKVDIQEIYEKVFVEANKIIQNISYGQTWLTGKVLGWVMLSKPVEDYGNGKEDSIARDAVGAADPYFDFAGFNRILIVHSELSWQKTNLNESYPSTSWNSIIIPTMDMVTFTDYVIVDETFDTRTVVHELGHAFGAVDLYDMRGLISDNQEPLNDYIGTWCIMGHGCAQMCLFTKLKIGWIPEDDIFELQHGSYSINILGVSADGRGWRGIKYDRINDTKYYLVEARPAIGLDKYQEGGILVTVVDETKTGGYGIADVVHLRGKYNTAHATLKIGDSFHDDDNSFFLHVQKRTEHGYEIIIGTEKYIASQEALFENPEYNKSVVSADLTEDVDGSMYSVVEKNNHERWYNYAEVYRSMDNGVSWKLLFNTSLIKMNCSSPIIMIAWGSPVLLLEAGNSPESHLILLDWRDETDYTIYNITESMVRDFSGIVEPQSNSVYITWTEYNATFNNYIIKYAIWNRLLGVQRSSTTIDNAFKPRIGVSWNNGEPYLLFRNHSDSNRIGLTRFNKSYVLSWWTNTTPGRLQTLDYDIICTQKETIIAIAETGWYESSEFHVTRVLRGENPDQLEEITVLTNFSTPRLFIREGNNQEIVLMTINTSTNPKSITLWNLTESITQFVQIDTDQSHGMVCARIYYGCIEEIILVSTGKSSSDAIHTLKLSIVPKPPYLPRAHYIIHQKGAIIEYIKFCGTILLGIIMVIIGLRLFRTHFFTFEKMRTWFEACREQWIPREYSFLIVTVGVSIFMGISFMCNLAYLSMQTYLLRRYFICILKGYLIDWIIVAFIVAVATKFCQKHSK
ncbi:MAG: hypothetical protein ACTSWA_12170 [Candidatus Thorarchaeota archaeon]